jgi:hypothetical protein
MQAIELKLPIFAPIEMRLTPESRQKVLRSSDSWLFRNDEELQNACRSIRDSSKIDALYQFLDASIAVASSFLANHAGTAPSHFPIFTQYFGNIKDGPGEITIIQNGVTANTLAEFLSTFVKCDPKKRPKINFVYEDRERSVGLLSKFSSMIRLTQKFKNIYREVKLTETSCSDAELVKFAINGNHIPSLNRFVQGDNSFIVAWCAAKSSRLYNSRDVSHRITQDLLLQVEKNLVAAKPGHRNFWLTTYIQTLLDFAFATDGAPHQVQTAIELARSLDDSKLIAHAQRFCNQTLGVSKEAQITLESSLKTLSAIPVHSEEFLPYMSTYFACKQNYNTTRFISESSRIDVKAIEEDYWEAKEICPSYSSIGRLADTAAIGYLMENRTGKAVELLEAASLEDSLPIANFNTQCNMICANFLHSACYHEAEFMALCDDLSSYNFLPAWEYHRVRIGTNLMHVASSQTHKDAAWEAIRCSSFLSGYTEEVAPTNLTNFLIKNRYRHYCKAGKVAGKYGKFHRKSGLLLAIDKDWL